MTFQHFPAMLVNCPSFHREISIDELLTGPPISLILAASVPLVPAPLESFLKTFCCAAWRKQSGKNPNALKTFHSTHLWLCRWFIVKKGETPHEVFRDMLELCEIARTLWLKKTIQYFLVVFSKDVRCLWDFPKHGTSIPKIEGPNVWWWNPNVWLVKFQFYMMVFYHPEDLSKCPCSDGFSYAKNGEIPSSGPK